METPASLMGAIAAAGNWQPRQAGDGMAVDLEEGTLELSSPDGTTLLLSTLILTLPRGEQQREEALLSAAGLNASLALRSTSRLVLAGGQLRLERSERSTRLDGPQAVSMCEAFLADADAVRQALTPRDIGPAEPSPMEMMLNIYR